MEEGAALSVSATARIAESEAARDYERARTICRGTTRLLHAHGYAAVAEVSLASGRRADLVAIDMSGEILVIEVKSSVADFRADQKWKEYREHCDRLLFAVVPDFPVELLPASAGLIVADSFGGEIVREGMKHPVAATRKSVLLRFSRVAASRLAQLNDPNLAYGELL
jgi:hypothetical protein